MLTGFLLICLPVLAVFSLLLYLPIYLINRKKHGKQPFLRHLIRYTFIGFCVSLLYLTVLWTYPYITFHPYAYFLNLTPFVWVKECYTMGQAKMIEQLLLNIGMFIPYGLLLPLTFKKMRSLPKTAFTVLLTTLSVETLQYFIGRSADIDDVIMNLCGGIIGYLLFLLLQKLFGRKTWWMKIL